jgi:hypothetical protein
MIVAIVKKKIKNSKHEVMVGQQNNDSTQCLKCNKELECKTK